MQNESKGVYVQMPKPDNDEAVKLLAELTRSVSQITTRTSSMKKAYYAAMEYLNRNGVVTSEKELILSEATV